MAVKTRILTGLLVVLFALAISGCASYYQVSDLNAGKTYYTKDVHYKGSGTVQFEDARNGNKVTLPSSEVKKIDKRQFEQGVYSTQK